VYKVDLPRSSQKSLDRLQAQERSRICSVLLRLEDNPRPHNIEKLKSAGLWRIREGDYRIVYHIDDDEKIVTVVRIGHRRDIYRGL
jgi:mRNA interferase RelE/StbE